MIDIVMCTLGKRTTLPVALRCLENQRIVNKIFVVSPHDLDIINSYRNTELVKEDDVSCLAWARKKGISYCRSKYLAFVDDDVLLHKEHLSKLHKKLIEWRKKYARPVVEGVLTTLSIQKMDYLRIPYKSKILKRGERGFTHNTLFLRETISDWNPPFIHVYEDLHLTQFIHSKGGIWLRYLQDVPSFHFSDHSEYSRKRWVFANVREQRLMGHKKVFNDMFRNLIYGLRLTLANNDVRFLVQKFKGTRGTMHGFYNWGQFVKLVSRKD